MNQPGILELISFGPDGWGKALLAGAWMTILIALAGYSTGAVIGSFGAWAKISGGRGLKIAADTYTTVLRGIPDLLVIYLFYFGGSAAVTAIGKLFGAEGFLGFPGFLAGSLAVGVTSGAHSGQRRQRTSRPSVVTSSSGMRASHRPGTLCSQRGWKLQPAGGCSGSGTLPGMAGNGPARRPARSSRGTDRISPAV